MREDTSVIPDTDPNRRQLHLRRIGLKVVKGPDAGHEAVFDHDVVRVGAFEGNHFALTDDTVSRRHAEIVRTQEGILLRDLGSTNGTYVGGFQVKAVFLRDQHAFRLGATEFEFTVLDEYIDIVASEETHFEDIVGQSVQMREMFAVLERVARTGLTVMVTGETGTGKELVSRAVHRRSSRKDGPFIVFDCGAVAKNLIESELFGHERGAFTGAVASRAGVFEQAQGGTIFLDELGELPLELQPALLRVLEQREVRRIGDRRVRPVDVRVVAATNRNLQQLVKEGRFREDLFYRLAVVEVALPPLRERKEDLPLLIEHILRTASFPHSVRGVTPNVLDLFGDYSWNGNVRELRNMLLRALPFCEGDLIDLEALPESLKAEPGVMPGDRDDSSQDGLPLPNAELTLRDAREQLIDAFERRYLHDLLQRCDGNLSRAAKDAGVDRKTISRMIKRLGIRHA